ncbi:MAG: T9SS type A sorting domain-containing protein [Bacteroidetes bacterium]|nr:T9SS type A sorting domain-containing protein [Bacteroidota bacterium]
MKRLLVLYLMIIPSLWAYPQWDTSVVGHTGLSSVVQSNGSLFSTPTGAIAEFPAGSNKMMFAHSGLWLLGLNGSQIHSAVSISSSKTEFWPGPIDTVKIIAKSPEDWNSVWEVSRTDINYHVQNFNKPDYQMPLTIQNWPARSKEKDINPVQAPFADWDKDGKYSPETGDYPLVPGNENAYTIYNDVAAEEHKVINTSNPLRMEVRSMNYTLNSDEKNHILIKSTYLINRSSFVYDTLYYGVFTDFILGNDTDNLVGTDVSRNAVYGYNADDNDEGENGYGKELPTATVVFLNQKLVGTVGFNQSDLTRSLPSDTAQLYNVMKGYWQNGRRRSRGNTGTDLQNPATPFLYSGTSDPDFSSENWVDEEAGHKNMLMLGYFLNVKPGAIMKLDVAYSVATGSQTGGTVAANLADEVLQHYNTHLGVTESALASEIRLYPNPANAGENLFITGLCTIHSIIITDLQGREIAQPEYEYVNHEKILVRCSEQLSEGIYQMSVLTESGIFTQRLIVKRI